MPPTLDSATAIRLNQAAGHAPAFNQLQRMVSDNHLLKCGAFMVATWWLWFRQYQNPAQALRNR